MKCRYCTNRIEHIHDENYIKAIKEVVAPSKGGKQVNIIDPYMLKPILTADGRPWVQRCYVCDKVVDFLKMAWGSEWLRVGELVRHKKCKPEALR